MQGFSESLGAIVQYFVTVGEHDRQPYHWAGALLGAAKAHLPDRPKKYEAWTFWQTADLAHRARPKTVEPTAGR